jgi:hypothetical protein
MPERRLQKCRDAYRLTHSERLRLAGASDEDVAFAERYVDPVTARYTPGRDRCEPIAIPQFSGPPDFSMRQIVEDISAE